MALPDWRQAFVTHIIDETYNTKRFFFEVPELTDFVFEPGQFVTLDLPIAEVKNKRWRSYSIASAPAGNNTFELLIVLNESGAGTTWMWENVAVGTEMILRGPLGKFTLPAQLDKDLFLICTGTGIAPFRSMVRHIYQHQKEHKNIYLIFGSRWFKDTLYGEEMRLLENELHGFRYLPTYSREAEATGLQKGYVHNVYEHIIRQQATALQPGDSQLPPARFFLCGWKNMIDETKNRLLQMGYEKSDIHYELYG